MSKTNVICGAKNILATYMSLMLHNYFFLTVKDQSNNLMPVSAGGVPLALDLEDTLLWGFSSWKLIMYF